jgi:lipopolysaccharide transport system permease protein
MSQSAALDRTPAPDADFARLPADFVAPPEPSDYRRAALDLIEGLQRWELWRALAWQDIRQRYRRSTLGPFWITLSMGVMIGTLGVLYAALFHIPIQDYLPFLSLGLLIWNLVSQIVNDGCICFNAAEPLIKQIRMPISTHVYRTLSRNVMIFAHNIVIYVVVAVIFRVWPGAAGLLVIPAFGLLLLNSIWVILLLGLLCARFRDVGLLVGSLLQVVFFVSPILWRPETLGNRIAFAKFNPVYHYIELIRGPLLGQVPEPLSWMVAIVTLIVGSIGTFFFFARFRRRLAFWL